MFTPIEGGSAFTLEGDSDTIAAYLALKIAKLSPSVKKKFAGLASDTIPLTGTLQDIKDLEINAWIAEDEEEKAIAGKNEYMAFSLQFSYSRTILPGLQHNYPHLPRQEQLHHHKLDLQKANLRGRWCFYPGHWHWNHLPVHLRQHVLGAWRCPLSTAVYSTTTIH